MNTHRTAPFRLSYNENDDDQGLYGQEGYTEGLTFFRRITHTRDTKHEPDWSALRFVCDTPNNG